MIRTEDLTPEERWKLREERKSVHDFLMEKLNNDAVWGISENGFIGYPSNEAAKLKDDDRKMLDMAIEEFSSWLADKYVYEKDDMSARGTAEFVLLNYGVDTRDEILLDNYERLKEVEKNFISAELGGETRDMDLVAVSRVYNAKKSDIEKGILEGHDIEHGSAYEMVKNIRDTAAKTYATGMAEKEMFGHLVTVNEQQMSSSQRNLIESGIMIGTPEFEKNTRDFERTGSMDREAETIMAEINSRMMARSSHIDSILNRKSESIREQSEKMKEAKEQADHIFI